MPELQMSGDIGFEELSPQLQALILSGAGSGGGFGGNVSLKTEVLSVTATEERQKEFTIPKKDYIQGTHNFELRIGSVWIHPDRYQILGNKIVFNEEEVGIAQGRRLDFVFYYLVKEEDGEFSLDGSKIDNGTITKEKLATELQGKIDSIETIKQSTEALSTKLDSSVKEVEASNNFNSIKIIKNDGTATDVPIKILGGGSGSSLNVFKTSEKGGSFTATTETNSFVINELEESMDVNLIFKNLFLVKDVDFTIDKESKTVVLTFNLKENETIYYTLTGTSFKYGDLDGAPNVGDTNSLATVSKEVIGAINEVKADVEKNSQSVTVLNNDRGYLNSNVSTDANLLIKTGKYAHVFTNTPTNDKYNIEVINHNDSFITQIAVLFANSGGYQKEPDIYIRNRSVGIWSSWKQIATSESVSNLSTLMKNSGAGMTADTGTAPQTNNLNEIRIQGTCRHASFTNYPSGTHGTGIVSTYTWDKNYGYQIYHPHTISALYFRHKTGDVYKDWQQIATTTQTAFACTANTGYTIETQTCYTLNNEFSVVMKIKKTDGSTFPANSVLQVATLPFTAPIVSVSSAMGMTSAWLVSANAYISGANIVIVPSGSGATSFYMQFRGKR